MVDAVSLDRNLALDAVRVTEGRACHLDNSQLASTRVAGSKAADLDVVRLTSSAREADT